MTSTPVLFGRPLTALLAMIIAFLFSDMITAQQEERNERGNSLVSRGRLTVPAQGVLELEVLSPEEIRAGESFRYEIRVTNKTDNIAVHDLRIAQAANKAFEIEKSQVVNSSRQGKQPNTEEKSGENTDQNENQNSSQQKRKDQAKDNKSKTQSSQSSGGHEWSISRLMPGETRQIQVTAAADAQENGGKNDEPASQNMCIAIASYTPTLCVATKIVKPELEIVKRQIDVEGEPITEPANLCKPIYVGYFVKNTGTGNTGEFVVTDELPEGLTTENGESTLNFTVKGLPAGETKGFKAVLAAQRSGEFASRAVAKTTKAGKETRSNRASIQVVAPELALAISGPETTYGDQRIDYTVRLTNHGDIASQNTQIELKFPRALELARTGKVRESSREVDKSNSSKRNSEAGQPVKANAKDEKSADQKNAEQTKSQEETNVKTWDVGGLEPGETVMVEFSLRGNSSAAGNHQIQATAKHVCGPQDEEQASVAAATTTQTEIIALPAMQIVVFDDEDPAKVGTQVVYTIRVTNEGEAADQDVQIEAEIPSGMKFVKGDGPTKVSSEEGAVKFAKLKTLEPGKRVEWKVTAKAEQEGAKRFTAKLNSNSLEKSARADEPTRVFRNKRSNNSDKESNDKENDQNNK